MTTQAVIKIQKGILQWDALSSILFVIMIMPLFKENAKKDIDSQNHKKT